VRLRQWIGLELLSERPCEVRIVLCFCLKV
jgi:hypothetical protein